MHNVLIKEVSLWGGSTVLYLFYALYPCRLKELRAENDRLEGRASAAERNATSLEAQRKSAIAEKSKLQKRVCTCTSL